GPIDCLIVPFPSNRWQYNLLARQSRAEQVIMHAYPAQHRAWLSSVGTRVEAKRGLHDVVQNLRLLEALGLQPDTAAGPRFELSRNDTDAAADLFRASGIEDRRPFIAVHAGSARTILAAAKRWPAAKYAALVRALLEQTGMAVALLEGPDERGVAREIVDQFSAVSALTGAPVAGAAPRLHCLELAGSLGVAGAVLQRARLYVGTDSGLAHLAAAVGTRAVTLFAPADPQRVCPFGNHDLVVRPAKDCSPCFMYPWESTKPKMRCCEPYCINEISVEMVMEKVRLAMPLHAERV
ncbi:MAG TPA: glycosyltransferase family 9 protein, partial [Tepidisphaeraceae bacterium]|nr:glycosyltransferase family 9 protein [Tepidisphaeraceae bacterium]